MVPAVRQRAVRRCCMRFVPPGVRPRVSAGDVRVCGGEPRRRDPPPLRPARRPTRRPPLRPLRRRAGTVAHGALPARLASVRLSRLAIVEYVYAFRYFGGCFVWRSASYGDLVSMPARLSMRLDDVGCRLPVRTQRLAVAGWRLGGRHREEIFWLNSGIVRTWAAFFAWRLWAPSARRRPSILPPRRPSLPYILFAN